MGWFFKVAALLSVSLVLAATLAWFASYAGPPRWRMIATAHSADLTRAASAPHTALFTTTPNFSAEDNHGFWDAWWALSHSGRLTLMAQVIDYEGTLQRVLASPPSLLVELRGEENRSLVVGSALDAGRSSNGLGFALRSDSGRVAAASARVWMLTLPYWFIALLGVPIPLLWVRGTRRRN